MHVDAAIARIAGRQLQLITLAQLQRVLTPAQIRHRRDIGLIRPVHPRVFSMVGGRLSFEQRVLAACLAGGEGAFASHATAAFVFGLIAHEPRHVDITIPRRHRRRLNGVVVHQTQIVGAAESSSCGPIPIARPARILLDIATSPRIDAAADEAFRRGLVDPSRLLVYLDRPEYRRLPGIATLRALARDRISGVPESVLEAKAIALIERYGLPAPVRQLSVDCSGRIVRFDLAYPDVRIAIELDGRVPHTALDRWQADHDRNNATELAGWRVLRFTWRDVTERPGYVARTIAEAIGCACRDGAR